MRRAAIAAVLLVGLSAVPAVALDAPAAQTLARRPGRDTEPVVLTGAAVPGWSAPADVTVKGPTVGGAQCLANDESPQCTHSRYEEPARVRPGVVRGVRTDSLLGYKWDGDRFVQIPFQVDELATRYLSNNASGFAFYSETDAHPTYVWDQERFRWTEGERGDPCHAVPAGGQATTPDPMPGLDDDDEIAFMASDAGKAAPRKARRPDGIVGVRRVTIVDPFRPKDRRYVYIMRAGSSAQAPRPAFDAGNGYVRYEPDADSDAFVFSQSSYGDYGNAAKGPYLDETTGRCITAPSQYKQRRPKDTAWVRTPRYAFRYDGRWLMTQVRVAPADKRWAYGPDLIDQWKARAFQQRPGGTTPCCGYEDEAVNWGGSSILMGVRAGPVRVIRATWGADSGTNVVRTETFYREEIRQASYLRVHPIPPADGIYSQWDYNAGKITKYYNPFVSKGVDVDGKSDEVFGNLNAHVGPDGLRFEDHDDALHLGRREFGSPGVGECGDTDACVDNDIDVVDPSFSGPHGTLNYEQVTGPYGTLVTRFWVKRYGPGNLHNLVTIPYYRDDSCFDDGTGTDPGAHLKPRHTDPVVDSKGQQRVCWEPKHGQPDRYPSDHFFQGDIGTHGIHVEIVAESDNAMTTVPLTEIDSEQRIVVLPGLQPNVGERYGRGTEKPLVVVVG